MGGRAVNALIGRLVDRAVLEMLLRVALSMDVRTAHADTVKLPEKFASPADWYAPGNLNGPADRFKLFSETQVPAPTAKSGRSRGRAPAEVAEFLKLPPQLRKQLLHYGARWTQAMFEPVTEDRAGS